MNHLKKLCAGVLLLTMTATIVPPAFAGSGNTEVMGVNISQSTFPDNTFRDYVSATTIDADQDGILSEEECNAVTSMSLDNKGITTLKGIEHFTKLTTLNCANNQLTGLDVDKNTALQTLDCSNNHLTVLNVAQNPALKALNVNGNALTHLDVSNNTELISLQCKDNSYRIALTKDRTFDLKTLPGNFDVNKAFAWEGGDVNGTTLTATPDAKKLIYSYDAGKGHLLLFELHIKEGEIAPSGVYTITFDANKGTVSPTTATTLDGKLASLPTPSREGYRFDGWHDAKGNAITLDTIFNADTTLVAQWKEQEAPFNQFKDVSAKDWFYSDVQYAYDNKLMSGTAIDTFSPSLATTRGMIMSILYRLEGSPELGKDVLGYPFKDVDVNMYYALPIYWARANKIASGYSATAFGPEDAITREQLAVFLYNYANFKKDAAPRTIEITDFKDVQSISPWAKDAMTWAVTNELISGKGDGILDPQGTATRAEVAAILHRYSRSMD